MAYIIVASKRIKISLLLCGVFFLGFIVSKIFPWLIPQFGVIQNRSSDPQYWYSFFTYWFLHGSIIHWFSIAITLVLIALIIEPRISSRKLLKISVTALLCGGFIYAFIGTSNSYILIGAGFLKNAYIGILMACFIQEGKTFHIIAKIFSIYIIFNMLVSLVLITSSFLKTSFDGLSGERFVGFLVVILSFLYTYFAIKRTS